MELKYLVTLVLVSGALALPHGGKAAKNVTSSDIDFAQKKAGVFIQQALDYGSTFQIINNADIKLEVSNLFHQVYILMEQLQISPILINQIKGLAQQDIEFMNQATANMMVAIGDMFESVYELNYNLRKNTLSELDYFYQQLTGPQAGLFNQKYSEYLETLTVTGNSVEYLIVSAINGLEGPEVSAIYALLQKSNDIINTDVETMGRELVFFSHDLNEVLAAVEVIIAQLPVPA